MKKELSKEPLTGPEEASKAVLDEFLWNIKVHKYKNVIKGMTKSFQGRYSRIQLLDWAENCIPFKLASYKIIERIERTDGVNSDVFHTYQVEVIDSSGIKFYCFPNVICEIEPYKAGKSGTWGVNPISIIPKGMYQKRRKNDASRA